MARAKLPYRSALINFHLPIHVVERIDAEAELQKKSKVRIAIEAFEGHFNALDAARRGE